MAIWVMGVNDKQKAEIVVRAGATSLVSDVPGVLTKWKAETHPRFEQMGM